MTSQLPRLISGTRFSRGVHYCWTPRDRHLVDRLATPRQDFASVLQGQTHLLPRSAGRIDVNRVTMRSCRMMERWAADLAGRLKFVA